MYTSLQKFGVSTIFLNVVPYEQLACILLIQSPNFTKNGADVHQDSLIKHAKSH